MSTPPLTSRRPEILLAILLSACLVALSLQVRRPTGETVGERWLQSVLAPFVDVVAGVRTASGDVGEWSSSRRALLAENRQLRETAEALEATLLRLRDVERDRDRLLALLGTHATPPAGTVAARLVEVESAGPFRTALLDRGADDGVKLGAVVVAAEGLLGRVVAVGAGTARVQLLSDRVAAAGVLLARQGRAAVARGDGKGGATILYVPTIEAVETNDPIVTSGTDGLYPTDLPVGRVLSVTRKADSLFWDIQVAMAADPARTARVFVLPPLRTSDIPAGAAARR
ncbi:MAG TPA: rod shape-determining protein MreC [Thermoanaerobaculia bacterium]|nr:rod shape-determining protein MreC [Thermoanaerobaculia bacterium]